MSIILLEGQHTGEFLVSEANNTRSRGTGVIKNAGGSPLALPAGLVLGTLSADSSMAPYTGAGTAGQQAATAILYDNVIVPPSGQKLVTLMVRDCEVNAAELKYDAANNPTTQAAAAAQLAAIGIVLR